MNKLVKLLNIAAFCCSVAAAVMVMALAAGMAQRVMPLPEFNRSISNMVAGYCCCYGLSQWIQKKGRTLSVGLMVVGTLILAANILVTG